MKRVFKYPLSIAGETTIEMPKGANVLTIQVQRREPYIWAMVEDDAPMEARAFCVRGTGHTFNGREGRYVGSFQLLDGDLVFHLFEAVAS